MKLFVPKETMDGENRVAASPACVKKLLNLGFEVHVEPKAGHKAGFDDALYREAGAQLTKRDEGLATSSVIPTVRGLDSDGLSKGAVVVGLLNPHYHKDMVQKYAQSNVTSFAMELIPRITRAQAMDVLSSQATVAGYKAVIDAVAIFERFLPMMITPAGTVAPARIFIMGAGVAGLQAIATARRLGAIVSATDVREATREQVESLGAEFVMVEPSEDSPEQPSGETAGGYAKEMDDAYKKRQQKLIEETVPKQDIIICTAQIPGKTAPRLLSEEMVDTMKQGAIVVDIAAEQGGNCALSQAGKTVVTDKGVKIIGVQNIASSLAGDASSFYANNIFHFLKLMVNEESKSLAIPWEDEIIKAACLTKDGRVIHESFAS